MEAAEDSAEWLPCPTGALKWAQVEAREDGEGGVRLTYVATRADALVTGRPDRNEAMRPFQRPD